MRVVHVAPASAITHGTHILANLDIVINVGLPAAAGTVPAATHEIPLPGKRPPGVNNETDDLGHGLLAIYLNQALDISGAVGNAVRNAMSSFAGCVNAGATALVLNTFKCSMSERTASLPALPQTTINEYSLHADGTVSVPSIVVAETLGTKWYGYPAGVNVTAVFTDKEGIQHQLGNAFLRPQGTVSQSPLPPLTLGWSLQGGICKTCFPWPGLKQPSTFNGLRVDYTGGDLPSETLGGLVCQKVTTN